MLFAYDTWLVHRFYERVELTKTAYDVFFCIPCRFGRIYESDYVAKETVKRVLRKQLYIYIPADKGLAGLINESVLVLFIYFLITRVSYRKSLQKLSIIAFVHTGKYYDVYCCFRYMLQIAL